MTGTKPKDVPAPKTAKTPNKNSNVATNDVNDIEENSDIATFAEADESADYEDVSEPEIEPNKELEKIPPYEHFMPDEVSDYEVENHLRGLNMRLAGV